MLVLTVCDSGGTIAVLRQEPDRVVIESVAADVDKCVRGWVRRGVLSFASERREHVPPNNPSLLKHIAALFRNYGCTITVEDVA